MKERLINMKALAWRFCKKCREQIIPAGDFFVDGLQKRKFRCLKCGRTYDFEVEYLDLLGCKVEYIVAFKNLLRKIPEGFG